MKKKVVEEKAEQPLLQKPALKKIVVYTVLVLLVFMSAVMVVFQVFQYRHDYRDLSSYMRERDDLNAEWGRLLIEQQTFGATAQIGTRAVTQLRMYSPPASQTVVISLPMTSEQKNKACCMVDKRIKQTRRKQQSISEKPTLAFDMWRFYLMWGVVLLCFVILIARAFYVQIINKDFLQNKANANILRTESLKAMRGVISDRHGVPLAISTPIMKIVIDPRDYFDNKKLYDEITAELKKDPNNRKLKRQLPDKNLNLDELADAVGIDRAELKRKLKERPRSRYLVLKKEVPPQQADLIVKRDFQGVYAEKNYKRYYPQPQPNAQIIGLTNSEGTGIEGLEMQLNKRLAGVDGEQKVIRDKRGNRLKVTEVIKEVEPGENITLSIDSRLQYILYRELTAAGIANNARSASAIAVDVKTGEILAMTSWPSYNPNDKNGLANKDAMRNRGAIDMFEPGSTMKPLSVAAALESGKYTPNTIINLGSGSMRVGNHTIRDTHSYGQLSVTGVIIKSSNVGVAKMALSLPYSTLPTFFKRIGFGQRSAVKFPGESTGLILPPSKWNVSEVATMSYGYGINATVLQWYRRMPCWQIMV